MQNEKLTGVALSAVTTQRLTLKSYSEADEAAMKALLTDETIKKTYMIPDFKSPDEAEAMFSKLLAYSRSSEHYERGIYLGNELIGFINDVTIAEETIEIGYVMSPAQSNKGYTTEAVKAAIGELFSLGFTKVIAGAFEGNAASMRVMEKCGMTQTGETEIIEYRGQKRLCIYYSITKTKIKDITDKTHEPDLSEIGEYIGNALFNELCDYLSALGAKTSIQYSRDNVLLGWNVKYFKGGRALCRLYPRRGAFKLLIVIGQKEKERTEALLSKMSDEIRAIYERTKEGMGQRWLIIELSTSGALFDDVKQLIKIRRESK